MRKRLFDAHLSRYFLSIILLTSFLTSALPIAAQKKRVTPAGTTPTVQPSGQGGDNQYKNCSGGWSGIVTYRKVLNYSEDFGVQKKTVKGTIHHRVSHEYKYAGTIIVDGSKNPNFPEAKGQVTLSDVRKKFARSEQKETCFYDGIEGSVLQWSETNESDATNAFGEGETGFSLNVNEFDGTYSFSFVMPEANGTNDRQNKQTRGGWCNPKNNQPSNDTNSYPTKIPPGGADINDQKIDPERPDVLSGSKSWEEDTTLKSSKFVYTVSWHFKRCPAPVEVVDVRFDEHPVGNANKWQEIEPGMDTIDGNTVRIRAKVVNFSGETRFPTVKFHETVENWLLPEGEKQLRLEPGEEREVELEWDTSGYAWKGKGWDAESNRRIKVEALDGARASQLTKPVVVSPRPVILVHGLWSNAAAWQGYDKFFEEGHSVYWKSYAVGANPSVAKMNTGEKFGNTAQTYRMSWNAVELDKQIEFVRKDLNAWHVDLVAHSMGGLISRYYISELMPNNPLGRKPVVTRLIMLGTPNMGSPCANVMYRTMALAGHKIWALWELRPDFLEEFNRTVRNRRGVRFSALVGRAIPQTCHQREGGDGVVPVSSGKWEVMDWRYSGSIAHTDLTSRTDFGAFVFPRLAVGPRGNHDPELVAGGDEQSRENFAFNESAPVSDRYGFNPAFQNVSYKKQNADRGGDDESQMTDGDGENIVLAKALKLPAKQSAEIEVAAPNAQRLGVVFLGAASVSARLTDAAGKTLGANGANSPESQQMFRTIAVEKTAAAGTWKLKFENRDAVEREVFVAVLADAEPLSFALSARQPNAAGQVLLEARLSENNAPLSGARVAAVVQAENGVASEIALFDDGAHGDGAAGDGVYAATTEKLADGGYLVRATAEINGKARVAVASFQVGGDKPAAFKTNPKTPKK